MEQFKNKQIFITGASKGIGKVIAEAFMEQEAEVFMPTHQELDLSVRESVERYIERNREQEYDVMVFCAAVNHIVCTEKVTYENVQETFQVNLFSSIQLLSHYIKKMKERKCGKVIFISSLYAMVSKEGRIAYSSSKSAISGLVRTVALESAPDNICVNAVAPGYVLTEMTNKNLSEKEQEAIKGMIPTHRFQTAQEIADLVLFLCSDKNKSITGQIISVDGGFLCR